MKPPPSQPNSPRVCVRMCDLDVIERLCRIFKCGFTRTERKFTTYSDHYEVKLVGGKAIRLMRQVHPHMGRRRRLQITQALKAVGITLPKELLSAV